jgi:apolipoprotein N-acyltransferase
LILYNNIRTIPPQLPNLKIKLQSTDINQKQKWQKQYKDIIIEQNLNAIKNAIKEKYDLIIFPETSFPLPLNKDDKLLNILKNYSTKIDIVIGALQLKDNLYYNSSYHISNKKVKIASKVVLVPFGEVVPFPQKIKKYINDTFYNGAKDYEVALSATTFNIKGYKFRNAICYEATTNKIYKNLDTNYTIAISNNAWFTPSIEPTLQKMLLKYYAKKYNLIIYSVTNKSGSGIIDP